MWFFGPGFADNSVEVFIMRFVLFLILLSLFFSCSKSDHEPESSVPVSRCLDSISEAEKVIYSDYIEGVGGKYIDPTTYSFDQSGFQKYLEDSGVVNFKASELVKAHDKNAKNGCGVENLLPERGCWPKGVAISLLLDRVRDEVESPIEVLSWYRSDCYNKVIGGATNSDHLEASAIDIKFENVKKFKIAKNFICQDYWKKGKSFLKSEKPLNLALGLGGKEMHLSLLSSKGRRFWSYSEYKGKSSKDECF